MRKKQAESFVIASVIYILTQHTLGPFPRTFLNISFPFIFKRVHRSRLITVPFITMVARLSQSFSSRMLDDDEPEMPEIDNDDSMEEVARKIAR